MRGLPVIAMGFACAADAAFCAGVIARGDVFGGSSKGGAASVAQVRLDLRPLDSTCIHGTQDWVDFEPVFTPTVEGLALSEPMLQGFVLNSNGTLRLSLNGSSSASGRVAVGAPPLSWGDLGAEASIHWCAGGAQEMCWACGRLHGTDDGVVCSHNWDCAACRDREANCTCPPIFVRVNWDDDDWDGDEDRLSSAPMVGDDELVGYRALGVTRTCWCHEESLDESCVSGLEASPELRLWSGPARASSGTDAFEIEAVAATEGIGTGSVRYEVRDATNGLLRTIVRPVTAANVEMRPDWDDSGEVDGLDRFLRNQDGWPSRWQVRVRETPYLLRLASECPDAAALDLDIACMGGVAPSLRSAETGAPLAAVRKNALQDVLVDTSAGVGDMVLTYSLGVTDGQTELTDTLAVHVVDTSVGEKWIRAGSASGASYDYSDVDGSVDWWVWRETDEGDEYVDGGYGPVFTLAGLEAGDYHVGVYFDGIFEDGMWGYSSFGDLHVVDVRLERLYETANPANRIFNPTRKDDTSGNFIGEKEHAGTELEERYAAPRNYLYVVGDPDTGDFNVTAQFSATGAETCTNYYCALYQDGIPIVGGLANVDFTTGKVAFSVPATTDEETDVLYELWGGLDTNGNGRLDLIEACPIIAYTNAAGVARCACVKGITREKYDDDLEYIGNRANFFVFSDDTPTTNGLPHARVLLKTFYHGTNTRGIPQELQPAEINTVGLDAFSSDGSCFAEWLTHNAGCYFGDNDVASISEYVWNEGSEMSNFIACQHPFALNTLTLSPYGPDLGRGLTGTGARLKRFYDSAVRDEAERILSDMEAGCVVSMPTNGDWYAQSGILSTNVFDSLSPGWVPDVTADIGIAQSSPIVAYAANILSPGILDNYEAYITIGRGRVVEPRYRFDVLKICTETGMVCVVTNVLFKCAVCDLYDFNYEDGGPATKAASLQIGYSNGSSQRGNHGKIFRHEINISKDYPWPFSGNRRERSL